MAVCATCLGCRAPSARLAALRGARLCCARPAPGLPRQRGGRLPRLVNATNAHRPERGSALASLDLRFQSMAQALRGKPTPLSRAEPRALQTYGHWAPRDTVGLGSRVVPLLDACTGALREDVRPR